RSPERIAYCGANAGACNAEGVLAVADVAGATAVLRGSAIGAVRLATKPADNLAGGLVGEILPSSRATVAAEAPAATRFETTIDLVRNADGGFTFQSGA